MPRKTFKDKDKVNVLGVWNSIRVACDDEDCPREHYSDDDFDGGRYHYEDGERKGRPGVVVERPNEAPRVVVKLNDGTEVSCDAKDVEHRG